LHSINQNQKLKREKNNSISKKEEKKRE